MRRIQACINLDADVKEYLASKPGEASELINRLVKSYMVSERVREEVDRIEPDAKEAVQEAVAMTKKEQKETEIKIRAFFMDHPAIVYSIIKGPPPTSKQYQRLKDRMEWEKYRIKTDCDTIKKILFEVVDTFDVKAYERTMNRL